MCKKAWMVKKLKKIRSHNVPRSEDLRYNYGWETKILMSLKALIFPFTRIFFTNLLFLKVSDDRIGIPIKSDVTTLIVR